MHLKIAKRELCRLENIFFLKRPEKGCSFAQFRKENFGEVFLVNYDGSNLVLPSSDWVMLDRLDGSGDDRTTKYGLREREEKSESEGDF